MPIHVGTAIGFTQSKDSKANHFWKYSPTHTQEKTCQVSGPPWPRPVATSRCHHHKIGKRRAQSTLRSRGRTSTGWTLSPAHRVRLKPPHVTSFGNRVYAEVIR